jgi:predicted nucleotidyltransferase
MKKRKIVLEKFLKKRRNKKEVIGILVCGSYITGNPSKHSDIDIHIILDKKNSWRERGNEIIDGILIEYFANPVKNHYKYMEGDHKDRSKINAHMLCTGKVLLDKTGAVKKLIQDAKKYLEKKYPKSEKIMIEFAKYHLRDLCDNLEEIYEAGTDDFFFVAYNCLYKLVNQYSKFLQFDSLPIHKVRRLLIDEKDKKKYHIRNFPDQEFVKIFTSVIKMQNKTTTMKTYKKLTNHVLKKM